MHPMSRIPYRLQFRTGVWNAKGILVLWPRKVSVAAPPIEALADGQGPSGIMLLSAVRCVCLNHNPPLAENISYLLMRGQNGRPPQADFSVALLASFFVATQQHAGTGLSGVPPLRGGVRI